MRTTIFAAGSRGDVQPCTLLGEALQRAGFEVLLAAPENFSSFVQDHGLPFHPLRGDVQQIMGSDTGREFMQSGGANPLKSIRSMRAMLGPVATKMAEDVFQACQNAEALISLAIFAPFAKTIADVRQIPLVLLEPTPMLPTRAFPAPGWPLQWNLGPLHNRLSGSAMLGLIWMWYRPFVNSFRQRFNLPPYSAGSFRKILSTTPLLGAYSPKVIPHPSDWPESVQITGSWFQDRQTGWQPPGNLQAFLEAGGPPVYVGFGSMSGQDPEKLAAVVLKALAKSGQRGLLLTGWGGMQALSVPESVFVIHSAPHSWLFPRMAAVVHHGGAGTTGEGLRAGVPSLVLPFMMDQPFWGQRVSVLGVGPEPIPQKKLTSEKLAHAIHAAVTQPDMKQRAAQLGQAIRAEDGLGNAVSAVKRYLES